VLIREIRGFDEANSLSAAEPQPSASAWKSSHGGTNLPQKHWKLAGVVASFRMTDLDRILRADHESQGAPSGCILPNGMRVELEMALLGESQSECEGWTITVGFAPSPFGICAIAESPRGICHLGFPEPGAEQAALTELSAEWPRAKVVRDDREAARLAHLIFEPAPDAGSVPPLRVFVRGSTFRIGVWQALARIPRGAVVSYSRLAEAIGQPRAVRAAASAVAANAVGYLVPCHRVIRGTGEIGGYRWGSTRKQAMLSAEAARS